MKITSKKEKKYKKHSIIEKKSYIRNTYQGKWKKKLFKKLYRKYKKAYIY